MIGGEDVVVEVDESKFGRKKANRGHPVEGVWVLGGVERTNARRVFLVPIEKRDKTTLLEIVSQHLLPGTVVYTDLWKGYSRLNEELGLTHRTVNHSLFFKDPVTQVHTNTIEGTWNGIKLRLQPRNRVKEGIDEHLFEFIWRHRSAGDEWNSFVKALAEVAYE